MKTIYAESPFNIPDLAIDDDKASRTFGWLMVQLPGPRPLEPQWMTLCDLKPHGGLLQATLLGWTATEWESALNDLLVWHITNPDNGPMPNPDSTEQARLAQVRWMQISTPRRRPACMSDAVFSAVRRDLERRGLLTGGPKG